MGKKIKKIGFGLALTGIAAGVSALAVSFMKKKKREEIYHEAELKAMNELDELMNEADGNSCCSDCGCSEHCCDDECSCSDDDEIYEQITDNEIAHDDDNDSKPEQN